MHSGLELTLLLLGCAVLGVVLFRSLQLPPMLGYLAVGVLIGPHALAVVHRVQAARDERYASLRGYFHGASDSFATLEPGYVRLHSVRLHAQASCVGRSLGDLRMEDVAAEVTALRRGGEDVEPGPEVVLAAGDVVVVRGDGEAVSRAEDRLL